MNSSSTSSAFVREAKRIEIFDEQAGVLHLRTETFDESLMHTVGSRQALMVGVQTATSGMVGDSNT